MFPPRELGRSLTEPRGGRHRTRCKLTSPQPGGGPHRPAPSCLTLHAPGDQAMASLSSTQNPPALKKKKTTKKATVALEQGPVTHLSVAQNLPEEQSYLK